jgi:PKD repeat protein
VTVTVTDNEGATAAKTTSVTVTDAAPTAAFTAACTNLACTFDGTASADTDGTVASYAWTFGDGSTGTGATASHSYLVPGSYTVTLTVTDDDGVTGAKTSTVSPTLPPFSVADAFGRTVTNGWGNADTGGAWTLGSAASNYAVTGSQGTILTPAAGNVRFASLQSVNQVSSDETFTVSTNVAPSTAGSGEYVYAGGRLTSVSSGYFARVRFLTGGVIRVAAASRTAAGVETTIGTDTVVSGLTYSVGTAYKVRVQVFGTNPTTIRAKVWLATAAEPSAWTISVTDSTAAYQVPGSVGVGALLSSSSTNAPVTTAFSAFAAQSGP